MGRGKSRRKAEKRKGLMQRFSVSFQNAGKGPNLDVVKEYHERVRAESWAQSVPVTKGISIERYAVTKKMEQMWQGMRHQGIQNYRHITLIEVAHIKLKMFFGLDRYFFVQENTMKKEVKKSIIYKSRERAMFVYKTNRIMWDAPTALPS